MEPISLVERGRRLPFVNEVDSEEEGSRKLPERPLWMRVENNCRI